MSIAQWELILNKIVDMVSALVAQQYVLFTACGGAFLLWCAVVVFMIIYRFVIMPLTKKRVV